MHFIQTGHGKNFSFWIDSILFPLSLRRTWHGSSISLDNVNRLCIDVRFSSSKVHCARLVWDSSSPPFFPRSSSSATTCLCTLVKWARRLECELHLVVVVVHVIHLSGNSFVLHIWSISCSIKLDWELKISWLQWQQAAASAFFKMHTEVPGGVNAWHISMHFKESLLMWK